jgi:hypothetical protein
MRATIGLIALLTEEARNLPDRAIELPMLAVSSALQMSLRAQQRYAALTARGDEVLGRGHITDEPPAWATFDDPVPADSLVARAARAEAEAEELRTSRSRRSTRDANGTGKSIRPPRNTTPSAFDAVDE